MNLHLEFKRFVKFAQESKENKDNIVTWGIFLLYALHKTNTDLDDINLEKMSAGMEKIEGLEGIEHE